MIPEGYDLDHFQRVLIASRDLQDRPLDMLTLATFLYEDQSKSGTRLKACRSSCYRSQISAAIRSSNTSRMGSPRI